MALVQCKECGERVSSKAKTCPNCGVKAPKKTSLFTWLVLIVIIFWAFGSIMSPDTASNYSKPGSSSTATSSRSNTSTRTPQSEPAWNHFTSKDEMTGETQGFASSPRATSTSPMEFPYNGTQAWLGIGCDGKSEWAYVGFTNAPNLNNTDTESGYNVVRTRVRWDEAVQNTKFTQKWGAAFLHFESDSSAIAKIAGAKKVLLELDWHGQRPVYFEFTLKGSSDAIKKMRAICK